MSRELFDATCELRYSARPDQLLCVQKIVQALRDQEALLREARGVIDDYLPDHPRDMAFEVSARITAHLGAEQ